MIRLVIPPTSELYTSAQIRAALHIDTTEDDAVIMDLIKEARKVCEDYSNMAFTTQTIDLVTDNPGRIIELPMPPLQMIISVSAIDDDGVETVVDSSIYRADTISTPGRIILKTGYSWPTHANNSGFRVRYVAGYTSADLVPAGIKRAFKMFVAYLYENPGDIRGTAQQGQLPDDVKMLLEMYRVYV